MVCLMVWRKRSCALCLSLCLFFPLCGMSQAADPADTVTLTAEEWRELKQDWAAQETAWEQLNQELKKLETTQKLQSDRLSTLKTQLTTSRSELEKVKASLATSERSLGEAQKQLDTARQSLQTLTSELEEARNDASLAKRQRNTWAAAAIVAVFAAMIH